MGTFVCLFVCLVLFCFVCFVCLFVLFVCLFVCLLVCFSAPSFVLIGRVAENIDIVTLSGAMTASASSKKPRILSKEQQIDLALRLDFDATEWIQCHQPSDMKT